MEEFNPKNLPSLVSKNPEAYAETQKPHDKSIPYNAEQVLKGKNFEIESGPMGALNMNADLGLQHTIRNILQPDILLQKDEKGIDHPTFVIISSGHAIAGLAAIAPISKSNRDGTETCLFDTSIYMPMGVWKDSSKTNVATQGTAAWGQSIANAKKKCSSYAGGVAIALNGHRGDFDVSNFNPKLNTVDTRGANVDAEKVFGSPDEFVKSLKKRGLNRIVVITETTADDPSKANKLPLEILKEGDDNSFNAANRDLYDFLKAVEEKGVEVVVVSGEQRVKKCKGPVGTTRQKPNDTKLVR